MKLPAHVERAVLVSQHLPQTYAMLNSDDDEDDVTAAARQVIYCQRVTSSFAKSKVLAKRLSQKS